MILNRREASRVIINPVDVRGGQSARDDKSHIRTWRAECAEVYNDVITAILYLL